MPLAYREVQKSRASDREEQRAAKSPMIEKGLESASNRFGKTIINMPIKTVIIVITVLRETCSFRNHREIIAEKIGEVLRINRVLAIEVCCIATMKDMLEDAKNSIMKK